MEDALLSPESFAILSGAGLMDASAEAPIYVHTTSQVQVDAEGKFAVDGKICWNGGRAQEGDKAGTNYDYHKEADVFCMALDDAGEVKVEPCVPASMTYDSSEKKTTIVCYADAEGTEKLTEGSVVLVDYYVKKTGNAKMIEITPDEFAGSYYLEGSTLFRRESDGVDMPAEFIIPNGKIQSNFTFSMASSGDPSTFTFTMDAFPGYTKFDPTKKVLAAIQVIEDSSGEDTAYRENCKAVF